MKIKAYKISTQSSDAKGTVNNPYTEAEFESMLNDGTWQGGFVENRGYCAKDIVVYGSYTDSNSWHSFYDYWSSFYNSWPSNYGSWSYENPLESEYNKGNSFVGENHENGNCSGGEVTSRGNNNIYPQTTKVFSGTALQYKATDSIGIRGTFVYQCNVSIVGYTMFIGVNIEQGNFTDRDFWATAVIKNNDNGKEIYKRLSYKENGYIVGSGWIVVGDVLLDLPKSGNITIYVYIGYNHDTGAGYINDSCKICVYPF